MNTVLPVIDGVMDARQLELTAEWIASIQTPQGMIPWFEGAHADPWNHVEAAMALDIAGRHREAERAYEWLAASQRRDGSWYNYYVKASCGGVFASDTKLDTNVCAYAAAGVWHHWLVTGDRGFVETMLPLVERAVEFVLGMRRSDGGIVWARYDGIAPWNYALVTGSASIVHSLRCAVAVAELLGHQRPAWTAAADRLAHLVRWCPEAFASKDRWSMDWYYPVLTGVVTGIDAVTRLRKRYDDFEHEGLGIRCVSDQPWVTAAETCECAIAHLAVGERETAQQLFAAAQSHRLDDGSYLTGLVYPDKVQFPPTERTTYTAAAVILAADALSGASNASTLFTQHPATA